MKVLIVDDDDIIREGLLSIDWSKHDIEIVGAVGNGEEALQRVKLY